MTPNSCNNIQQDAETTNTYSVQPDVALQSSAAAAGGPTTTGGNCNDRARVRPGRIKMAELFQHVQQKVIPDTQKQPECTNLSGVRVFDHLTAGAANRAFQLEDSVPVTEMENGTTRQPMQRVFRATIFGLDSEEATAFSTEDDTREPDTTASELGGGSHHRSKRPCSRGGEFLFRQIDPSLHLMTIPVAKAQSEAVARRAIRSPAQPSDEPTSDFTDGHQPDAQLSSSEVTACDAIPTAQSCAVQGPEPQTQIRAPCSDHDADAADQSEMSTTDEEDSSSEEETQALGGAGAWSLLAPKSDVLPVYAGPPVDITTAAQLTAKDSGSTGEEESKESDIASSDSPTRAKHSLALGAPRIKPHRVGNAARANQSPFRRLRLPTRELRKEKSGSPSRSLSFPIVADEPPVMEAAISLKSISMDDGPNQALAEQDTGHAPAENDAETSDNSKPEEGSNVKIQFDGDLSGETRPFSLRGRGMSLNQRERQCTHPGCLTRAYSRGLCKFHGGGHRCEVDGCNKSAQAPTQDGKRLCKSHGGGKRCEAPGCGRCACPPSRQGAWFCVAHGGGHRCSFDGCSKPAKRGLMKDRKRYCGDHVGVPLVRTTCGFQPESYATTFSITGAVLNPCWRFGSSSCLPLHRVLEF